MRLQSEPGSVGLATVGAGWLGMAGAPVTMSPDPAARERSIAAIRGHADNPQNVHALGALKHGGKASDATIAPLADAYLAELLAEFPTASERVLLIQARRLARLELLGRFEDQRGVLRNRKRGEPFPATVLAERISTAYLSEHARLEAGEREAGGKPRQTLAEIAAEYADDGEPT